MGVTSIPVPRVNSRWRCSGAVPRQPSAHRDLAMAPLACTALSAGSVFTQNKPVQGWTGGSEPTKGNWDRTVCFPVRLVRGSDWESVGESPRVAGTPSWNTRHPVCKPIHSSRRGGIGSSHRPFILGKPVVGLSGSHKTGQSRRSPWTTHSIGQGTGLVPEDRLTLVDLRKSTTRCLEEGA